MNGIIPAHVGSTFSQRTSSTKRATSLVAMACAVATAACLAPAAAAAPVEVASAPAHSPKPFVNEGKPRTIITTDGEIDDLESFVRALYYANEVSLEGIVLSSSKFHWKGNGDDVPWFNWTDEQWVFDYIDAYAEEYPNLIKHAKGYPSPETLRSLVKVGNIENVGEMEKVTEGSELIKEAILKDDPDRLFIQVWGGPNTTARALKSIEEEYAGTPGWPAIQAEISRKVVLYNILDQDPTLGSYIRPNWPDIKVIDNLTQFESLAYSWRRAGVPADQAAYLKGSFIGPNIITDHGPLASKYIGFGDGKTLNMGRPAENFVADPTWMSFYEGIFGGPIDTYDFVSEGDSPSFMALFDFNGLRSSEDPSWGGWGGRFEATSTGWADAPDTDMATGELDANLAQTRWISAFQRDFAARADWGSTPRYEDANHLPLTKVASGLDLSRKAGATVVLSAVGKDPDGDRLTYRWWQYLDAGTYEGTVPISGADTTQAKLRVPIDAQPGDTIHIILEVTDDGSPALTTYERVVLTVSGSKGKHR